MLVVHYENLKSDIVGQLKILMNHLDLSSDAVNFDTHDKQGNDRIQCLLKFKDGFFKRESSFKDSSRNQDIIKAFPIHVRAQMDDLIDNLNINVLRKNGYPEMPLSLYRYYRKVCVILILLKRFHERKKFELNIESRTSEFIEISDRQ